MVKRQVFRCEQFPTPQSEKCRDRCNSQRHQHWNQLIDIPDRQKTCDKYDRCGNLFGPGERIVFLDRLRYAHRRFAKTEIQSVVRTYADAVHTFHTTRIDDHSVLLDFGVDDDVRCADGGAMATFITGVGDADLARCKFVCDAEKTAIRTGVSAKPF